MTTQIVRYTSVCPICAPGVTDIHICVDETIPADGTHSIEGNIVTVSVCQYNCNASKVYTYTLSYDDTALSDPNTLLKSEDILGIVCSDCFTQWILDHVNTTNIINNITTQCACIPGNTNTVCGCDTFDPTIQLDALRNSVFGYEAGEDITSGDDNILIGYQSGWFINTGLQNTIVGTQAGYATNTDSMANILVGYRAGYQLTNNWNVAIGRYSLRRCTSVCNIAVGDYAGENIGAGYNNIAIGDTALGCTVGATDDIDNNTVVGYRAATNADVLSKSVAIGSNALWGGVLSSVLNTVAVGYESLWGATNNSNNTAVGYQSGYRVSTGSNNSLLGYQTCYSITTGSNNVAIGYQAAYGLTTGTYNISIGSGSMLSMATAINNVTIGTQAAETSSSSMLKCISIGYNAHIASRNATKDIVIGNSILSASATDTSECIAIGNDSLLSLDAYLEDLICIGNGSIYYPTSEITNAILIGNRSLAYSVSAESTEFIIVGSNILPAGVIEPLDNSILIGHNIGTLSIGIIDTVSIGSYTAIRWPTVDSVIVGSYSGNAGSIVNTVAVGYCSAVMTNPDVHLTNNVSIGYYALSNVAPNVIEVIENCVLIGANADIVCPAPTANVVNSIGIGYDVSITKSNQVIIGNSSIIETNLRRVLLATGAAASGSYPLKFQSGTLLTAPELGAMEFDGDHLYITTTGGRQQLT